MDFSSRLGWIIPGVRWSWKKTRLESDAEIWSAWASLLLLAEVMDMGNVMLVDVK